MKVLSYRQPWAFLVATGIKPVENRTWRLPEKMKGQRVLIHASKKPDTIKLEIEGQATSEEIQLLSTLNYCEENELFSAIIGSVEMIDCVQNHPSVWAEKDVWNWVLADPVLFSKPIQNVKGKLGFWDYPMTEEEYLNSGKN